jgi:DNA-binding Lrp family transcriptional regulator
MKGLLYEVDLQIIRRLQDDGRMASSEIAKTIGIPEATIRYRLKKMTDKIKSNYHGDSTKARKTQF